MILITGAAGFIGSALAWELNCRGNTQLLLADHLGSTEKWRNLVGLKFTDYLEKDRLLSLIRSDAKELGSIKAILHLGACSSTTEENASYLVENNLLFSQELATWALQKNIKMLYASSAATYGAGELGYSDQINDIYSLRPLNAYALSKQLFDQWAFSKGYSNRLIGLKFFNVYGPNEYHKGNMRSMVHKAYGQITTQGKVQLFQSHHPDYSHGGQLRDFLYIKDATALTLHLLENSLPGGLYNLGTGEAHSWVELMTALFKALNKPVQIDYIPMPHALQAKYQYFTQADMKKTLATGYPHKFRTLQEAVSDYVTYLQKGEQTLAWHTPQPNTTE